ncbi:MAG: AAA family ATPase, partial [Actinobacteria bacterium]|nr:AAA family ATPase [Actinomycetota bacterium]
MALFPLVARAGALADIDAALAAARASRGSLVLVTGEPGIGKSRLLAEAADRARGFRAVRSWCPPAATGAALRPWSQVVRALAGADTTAARLVSDSPYLTGLAAAGQRLPGDPEGARSQLAFDLAGLVAATAARRPVLLIIDDLHDADASSLRLLAELAPSLRGTPAVVLGAARDSDLAWQDRLGVRGTLMQLALTIGLQPLTPAEVAGLISADTGRPADPDLARMVCDRSGGNPFLATELIRQLAGRPGAAAAAESQVPGSVRAIAAARLAELPERAREAVAAAAVAGTRFRLDVLAEITGIPLAGLGGALADAHRAGLLAGGEAGEDRFRHDLIRDAIYDTIPAPARAAL